MFSFVFVIVLGLGLGISLNFRHDYVPRTGAVEGSQWQSGTAVLLRG
jgi:hypothetical protein